MCIICTGEIYKQNLNTLTELNISYCSNLTSEKLQEILTQCKNLIELRCDVCKSLTSLNLQNLIKLQRWYRKIVIIKYMKSQQFIEWIYAPNNIGGRLYKKWLLKNLK